MFAISKTTLRYPYESTVRCRACQGRRFFADDCPEFSRLPAIRGEGHVSIDLKLDRTMCEKNNAAYACALLCFTVAYDGTSERR